MSKVDRIDPRRVLAFSLMALSLAITAAYRPAHAATVASQPQSAPAVDQTASTKAHSQMTACKQLPASDQGICAAQAGYGQPVMLHELSPEQQQTLARENARYKEALAACNRLPASDRTICVSQAGTASELVAKE